MHFHQLFLDGCYELDADKKPTTFWGADPPTVKEIEEVLAKIIARLTKYLEKQKIIIKDNEEDLQLPIQEEDTLSKLQQASVTYRFATGPNQGKKAMVLKTITDGDHNSSQDLVAKHSGFSLHAGVAVKADDRKRLERICRYIARPAVAEERLSTNEKGDVIYRFKKPWRQQGEAVQLRMPLRMTEPLQLN